MGEGGGGGRLRPRRPAPAALAHRHALLITVGTFLASAALLRLGTRHRPARVRARERGGTRQLPGGVGPAAEVTESRDTADRYMTGR